MKIYFAADHAGFELKSRLMSFVRGELGHEIDDCGAFENNPEDDYPDFVAAAALKLSHDEIAGTASAAIVIGASGEGEMMVANKFPRVRAALYYGKAGREQRDMSGNSLDILASTRKHNRANCLCLGARFLAEGEAEQAVREWLSTPLGDEERHVRRIAKMDALLE